MNGFDPLPDLLARPLTDRAGTAALVADIAARAVARGIALRPPPPEPVGCCGRGCNGCVWEGYYAAVEYWRCEAGSRLSGSSGGS